MEPKTALIITIIGIVFLLFLITYVSFQCNRAIKKLKLHGEKLYNRKK